VEMGQSVKSAVFPLPCMQRTTCRVPCAFKVLYLASSYIRVVERFSPIPRPIVLPGLSQRDMDTDSSDSHWNIKSEVYFRI